MKLGLKIAPETSDITLKQYYEPTGIKANVVLAKNPATATCGKKAGVRQKFSIRFDSNADATKLVQKTSGNPGYLDGYPLKVGFLEAAV